MAIVALALMAVECAPVDEAVVPTVMTPTASTRVASTVDTESARPEAEVTTTTLDPFAVVSTGSGERSPLDAAFAARDDLRSDPWAGYDEERVQELIGACMRAAGFDYWPPPPQDFSGLVLWPTALFVPTDTPLVETAVEDRNAGYLAGLGDAERAAYLETLTGIRADDPTREGEGSDSDEDATGGSGCDGQARRSHNAEILASTTTADPGVAVLYERLDETLRSFHDAVSSDPAVLTELAEYAGCLAGLGYPIRFPDDPYDTVYWMPFELVLLIREEGADLLALMDAQPDTDLVDLVGRERLDQLIAYETGAHRAHAECLTPLEGVVRAFELQFITDHENVLGEYAP